MAQKSYDYLFKLIMLGDPRSGKSDITMRFTNNPCTLITGVDFLTKTVELRGKSVKLQIWNIVGGERIHTIAKSYYRGAKGFFFVYDITQTKTFEVISWWLDDVNTHTDTEVEKVLLGNNCDKESYRMVTKEMGEVFAKDNNLHFLETSSNKNINIDRAFMEMAERILDQESEKTVSEKTVNLDSNTGQKEGKCF